MLNYETLLSSYDDKLTLLQWLKKLEAALKDASAVDFKVNKKGDATLTFSIVFEDGSEIESGEIVLQQGESVESAAIVNGHLILTLTNGDELDAGQLLNGDLNVSGNLSVSGNIASSGKITGAEIVEDMAGYGFTIGSAELQNVAYAGVVKNGNKITFAIAADITPDITFLDRGGATIGEFSIPVEVWNKLYPFYGHSSIIAYADLKLVVSQGNYVNATTRTSKTTSPYRISVLLLSTGMTAGTKYYYRFEATYLLSENLAA